MNESEQYLEQIKRLQVENEYLVLENIDLCKRIIRLSEQLLALKNKGKDLEPECGKDLLQDLDYGNNYVPGNKGIGSTIHRSNYELN